VKKKRAAQGEVFGSFARALFSPANREMMPQPPLKPHGLQPPKDHL
jgi:hypothetical protein